MNDFDPAVAHAMNLAVLAGIIRALQRSKLVSPWTITEQMSLIFRDSGKLHESERAGFKLAQEWVYEEFTKSADPNGTRDSRGKTQCLGDISKLREIIETKVLSVDLQLLYQDAFAAGCYLHLAGEKAAGRKLCYTLFRTLDFNENSALFSRILEALDGNEQNYVSHVGSHHELNTLFDRG